MGMSNDNAERVDMEAERDERNKVKVVEEVGPSYTIIGPVYINGEHWQLLSGNDDKKWYKSKYISSYRLDYKNMTDLIPEYSKEIIECSIDDMKCIFGENVA